MRELFVIGTTHKETSEYSADELASILIRVRPDVLLTELTSDFYADDWKRHRYFDSQEDKGVRLFLQSVPTVERPYDIEGRNQYYEATQYFEKERGLWDSLEQIHSAGKLSETRAQAYQRMMDIIGVFRGILDHEHPRVLNSRALDIFIEYLHKLVAETLRDICGNCEELAPHKHSFLEREAYDKNRNSQMARNILARVEELSTGSRFAVLCGLEHRYMLRRLLQSEHCGGAFHLREYWE